MPPAESQQFLRDLDRKLWSAADRVRSNLDAAVYKRAVLRLWAGQIGAAEAPIWSLAGSPKGERAEACQTKHPTTWRLAAMNMAIRGIDFTATRGSASKQHEVIPQSVSKAKDHFGKEPANSFTSDQHPDLRADYVMANPPFNISEWWDAKLEGDPRWRYGTPPRGNANFA